MMSNGPCSSRLSFQSETRSTVANVLEHIEGVARDSLIVLIIADQTTAVVGRQYLGLQEVLMRKRTLARSTWTDEHDQAKFWNADLHLSARTSFRFIGFVCPKRDSHEIDQRGSPQPFNKAHRGLLVGHPHSEK